jgi:pyrrolidone-carboxylate peptidase
VHEVLQSPGEPLTSTIRSLMEPRFGHNFAGVRVHADGLAAESARSLNASAYTVGRDVVFGWKQYAPETYDGRKLLAHELAHTIQQGAAQAANGKEKFATLGLSGQVDGASEREADSAAAQVLDARHLINPTSSPARAVVTRTLAGARIQRQPQPTGTTTPCTTMQPENCILFGDWLSTFASLPSFQGSFTDPQGRARDFQQVIGERAPASLPNPPPAPLRGNTQGIERPWAGWLRSNLPPALIETAYELPTDCADIVLILRHVWLAAHGRTERVRQWTLGQGVSRTAISGVGEAVTTGTLKQGMIAFYRDANGLPIRSLNSILPLLHPGDVLVWEHRNAQGVRTGGHSETIDSITRNPTAITTLQGNQPLTSAPDDARGQLRGWRIERGGLDPGDLRDINGVWTWRDGTTVLIGAGPWGGTPTASQRQPRPARGAAARVLRDWSPALNGVNVTGLPGVLEGALGETRAALEGQRIVPLSEARSIGEQIGRRLWSLAHSAADLGVASHFEPLEQLLQMLEAYHSSTRVTGTSTQTIIDQVYREIREALDLAARGVSSINFNRAPATRGARSVNILLTGFDPFTAEGMRPGREQWNTSGAAAMALDGERIPAGGNVFALVESVVLPVDFNRFATGMVENIARPLLPTLDAVVTVSMDSSLTGQAAIERFAVNFHHVDHPQPGTGTTPAIQTGPVPLPPVTGGMTQPAPGPAVMPTWQAVDRLTAQPQTGQMGTFVRSDLTLRFGSVQSAQTALQDMGLSATQFTRDGMELTITDSVATARLVNRAQTPAGQPAHHLRWSAFGGQQVSFDADVVSGPGGSFLSNEVSYRMLRLIRQQGAGVVSFHVHTPDAPAVPVAARTNQGSPLRRAAMTVRASVIAGLRRVLAGVARILRP